MFGNNRRIYFLFYVTGIDFTSFACSNIFSKLVLNGIDWSKFLKMTDKYCITNYLKEVSYTIFHRVYPVKSLVIQFFKVDVVDICVTSPETFILGVS